MLQPPFKVSAGPDLVVGETTLAQFKQKHPEAVITIKIDDLTKQTHAIYTQGNVEFFFYDIKTQKYNETTMKLVAVTIRGKRI